MPKCKSLDELACQWYVFTASAGKHGGLCFIGRFCFHTLLCLPYLPWNCSFMGCYQFLIIFPEKFHLFNSTCAHAHTRTCVCVCVSTRVYMHLLQAGAHGDQGGHRSPRTAVPDRFESPGVAAGHCWNPASPQASLLLSCLGCGEKEQGLFNCPYFLHEHK